MILKFDFAVHAWMQAHHVAWVTVLLRAVSVPTSGQSVAIWTGLLALAFFFRRRYRLLFEQSVGTYLGLCLTPIFKDLFVRERPLVEGKSLLPSYAFPSGHALSITVFCGLLAAIASRRHPERRILYWGVASLIILSTALSRVYLGYHWATDVLAGILLGALYVIAWMRLVVSRY